MIGADTHGGSVTCRDCGLEYLSAPDQIGTLCEECCADRDAHTDALEVRLMVKMVKAVLRSDLSKVKDVA